MVLLDPRRFVGKEIGESKVFLDLAQAGWYGFVRKVIDAFQPRRPGVGLDMRAEWLPLECRPSEVGSGQV